MAIPANPVRNYFLAAQPYIFNSTSTLSSDAKKKVDGKIIDILLKASFEDLESIKTKLLTIMSTNQEDLNFLMNLNSLVQDINKVAYTKFPNQATSSLSTPPPASTPQKEVDTNRAQSKASAPQVAQTSVIPDPITNKDKNPGTRPQLSDIKEVNKPRTGDQKSPSVISPPPEAASKNRASDIPDPIKEKRAPKTKQEQDAVKAYMITEVINGSNVPDKDKQIAALKIKAKTAVYDRNGLNPGSIQAQLSSMHRSSYEAFKTNHPYLF